MCQVSPSQKTEKHVFIFLRVPRDKTRPGRAVGAPQSNPAEAGPHPSLLPAACGAPSCPEESPTPAGGRSASPFSPPSPSGLALFALALHGLWRFPTQPC